METLKKRRVESFEIVLEHDIDEQYQYVPGEMMKGVLVITCNEEIKVQQLLVTLQGEGNVIWETEHRSASKQAGKFRSREIYLDHTEDLIQHSGGGGVSLEVGQNEFPFYYQLNENLPSSYIGKYGSVTYLIKAQLRPDRRHGADAMITNEPFLVLRRYDLSLEPFKLQPYEDNRTKSVGAACLCGGKLTVFIKLNRTGFIPGEDLRLNADVANGSSSEITSLQAALIMTATFHATKSQIHSDQTISKHVDSYAIEQGEGRRWNDVRLTIPPYIPESSLEGCDIIDLNYSLLFQVELDYNPKSKHNLRLEIPITIGTHGIRPDDDPADEPDLRPLYTRASTGGAEPPVALRREDDEDDDIGEIDISLFESGAQPGYKGKFTKKKDVAEPAEPAKPIAAMNVLYGDLVSEDDLPDSNMDGTIRENPLQAASSRKKKKAPEIPTAELQQVSEEADNDNNSETGETSHNNDNEEAEDTKL